MTRRERLERKLEQRREWADKANRRSSEEMETARKITEHIPFGQPILVGHHSEGAHRRLIARSAGHMDRSVEQSRLADYHEGKAEGIERQLENTVFSDDPDALDRLREKLEKLEALQERMKAINKIVRTKGITEDQMRERIKAAYPDLDDAEVSEIVCKPPHLAYIGPGFPSYALTNNNATIRRVKERIAQIERRQARQEAAENASGGVLVEGQEYVRITFSEKPAREVLNDLKAAGFYWRGGSWCGRRDQIPESVAEMAGTSGEGGENE